MKSLTLSRMLRRGATTSFLRTTGTCALALFLAAALTTGAAAQKGGGTSGPTKGDTEQSDDSGSGSSDSGSDSGSGSSGSGSSGSGSSGSGSSDSGSSGSGSSGSGSSGSGSSGSGSGGSGAPAGFFGDGWTTLIPSGDSRIIYVSDSQGSDSNDGLSPQTPVRTIAKGYSLLRSGFPDWMLLRRGDTFTNQVLHSNWGKSGRSKSEPMVISSYGSSPSRPKILTPPTSDGLGSSSGSHKHLAFVGLHLEPHNRQPNQAPRGIRWLSSVQDILIEDCYIGNYRENMIFQVWNSTIKDVRIRRSVIVDAWSASNAHSQGIFAKEVDGLLLEENVFDHNGWHPTISGAEPTIYNHNMYVQRDNKNVVVRGNILSRAAATGLQLRPGGLMEDNLSIRNPVGLLFGQFQNSWPSQGVTGTVRNNVVLDARDINASNPIGRGIVIQQVLQGQVYGNVVAHQNGGTNNITGIHADYNYQNLTIRDNVVYNWQGGRAMRFLGTPHGTITVRDNILQQPNSSILVTHQVSMSPFNYIGNQYHGNGSSVFSPGTNFNGWVSASGESGATWQQITPANSCSHAAADLPDYMKCIGYPASYTAFINEARKQSRMNWRPEFTAYEVNAYIRASYGLPPEGY